MILAWLPWQRWQKVGMATMACLSLALTACNTHSVSTFQHDSTVNPRFAVYLTNGKQGESWTHNQPNTNPCHDWTGGGTQTITFTSTAPVYVYAVKYGNIVRFVKGDYASDYDTLWQLGTPPQPINVIGQYNRTGTSDYHQPASCGTPVGSGGGDGGNDSPPDCGVRQLKPGLTQLDYYQGKVGILPYQGGNWYVHPAYLNCPTELSTNPYVTSAKTPRSDGVAEIPRFQADLPQAQLFDSTKLSIVARLPQTASVAQDNGSEHLQLSQSWDMTFCRLNSDQNFQDAFQTALNYLEGSDIFMNSVNDVGLLSKYIPNEFDDPSSYGNESFEHPGAAAGARGKHEISISWNHISDTTRTAEVIAHEMFHAISSETNGFESGQAAPFVTLSEYKALTYQEEYEANVFAYHVLKDLEKFPDRKPCIEAMIQSMFAPVLYGFQTGNDQGARNEVIREYGPDTDLKYTLSKARYSVSDLADVKARIDLMRQSGDLQGLVNTWNTANH